jgi:hypothetical protein
MLSDEASIGQNTGCGNPAMKVWNQPIPQRAATLAATTQDQALQMRKPLDKVIQIMNIIKNCVVVVMPESYPR